MKTSESIACLAKALCAAKKEIKNAAKNSVNPHLKNKYADLESVLEAIEPMHNHGLVLSQLVEGGVENILVTTILMHESGEFIESTFVAKPDMKLTMQGAGSAITYARRYMATAVMGITQSDDDGDAASRPQQKPLGGPSEFQPKPPPPQATTGEDVEEAAALSKALQDAQNVDALKAILPGLSAFGKKVDRRGPLFDSLTALYKVTEARVKK